MTFRRAIFARVQLFSFVLILTSPSIASAAEYTVDPSWMTNFNGTGYSAVYINNIMDTDPATLGRPGSGIEALVLQPGDTLTFSAGTYQLGLGLGNFEVRASGTEAQPITIQGDGWDDTIFRGAELISGKVWGVYGSNVVLKDFRTENAAIGIRIEDSTFEYILIDGVKTIEHDKHYMWPNQQDVSLTTSPSVLLSNAYIKGGSIGVNFIGGEGATQFTKYVGIDNSTLDGIDGIGIDAPIAPDGNGGIVILGNDDFNNNIVVNSNAPFTQAIYQFFSTPSGFVESNLEVESLEARNIQPSNPALPLNIEADPMLDASGRPTFGSPAIGPQYPRGYSGAVPPLTLNRDGSPSLSFVRGDVNNDFVANAADIQGFTDTLLGPNLADQTPAYQRMLFASDCNANNALDDGDIDCFATMLAGDN